MGGLHLMDVRALRCFTSERSRGEVAAFLRATRETTSAVLNVLVRP
jgi:hypothetical protein